MTSRKIWFIWLKGTWKDFIYDLVFSSYKKFTLGDLIKDEVFKSANFLSILYKDLITYKSILSSLSDKELLSYKENYLNTYYKVLWEVKIVSYVNIDHIEDISNLIDTIDLVISKKKKIWKKLYSTIKVVTEYFKNIPTLKIREYIHSFYDTQDKKWYDIWSNKMVEELTTKENLDKNIVFTDCRMLIEAIDFLLVWWVLVTLYNSRSRNIIVNTDKFLHSTELQLNSLIDKEAIWIIIDTTSYDNSYLKKMINELLDIFYSNFRWYSLPFINKLYSLREEVMLEIPKLEKELDLLYKNNNRTKHKQLRHDLLKYQNKLRVLVKHEYRKHFKY